MAFIYNLSKYKYGLTLLFHLLCTTCEMAWLSSMFDHALQVSLLSRNKDAKDKVSPCAQYSCNKITNTRIQISCQNWNDFFSNISHQMMIWLTPKFLNKKTSGINGKKRMKFALNSQLQPYQILTNDVQMLIWRLSYFVTAVIYIFGNWE